MATKDAPNNKQKLAPKNVEEPKVPFYGATKNKKTVFGVSYSHGRPITLFHTPAARTTNGRAPTVTLQHAMRVHDK